MSGNALDLATSQLLDPFDLSLDRLGPVFSRLLGPGVDDADIYFQHSRQESWSLDDSIVKSGSHSIDQGVGLRAMSGEKTGFAYCDEIRLDALTDAASAARAIARDGQTATAQALRASRGRALYAPIDPIESLPAPDKVALLSSLDRYLRDREPLVREVSVSLSGGVDTVFVANAEGRASADVRPLVRLNIQVIVERDGRREQGYAGIGGRYGYEKLLDGDRAYRLADEALRQALVSLDSVAAPAGSMPVVLGSGWPGVLLHEAVGHGLEGDFNRKGTSVYAGQMGELVASELCTIVDDGSLPERRGSLTVDDEGEPTGETTLIENGRLVGYLQDRLNARLMGVPPTGNGRRESFAHLPMPRMTNTFMRAGQDDPADIIASVDRGLYAVNFSGGQVDITSGKFVFSTSEAYLIEKGRITAPVRGATLIGNGPDVMRKVDRVGHDLALDDGIGTCGKAGQSVPVGVGQPTLRISSMTVGGTQE